MKKIAVLDSGVKCNHPAFSNTDIKGLSIQIDKSGEVITSGDFHDEIGHGTAIFYLISKLAKDSDITNIKIYDSQSEISTSDFEHILEYILSTYHFDIINISMGIVMYGNTDKLQAICKKFKENGTIIVSAFDNYGAVSFPAALDDVIGVDGQLGLSSKINYILVNNSIVNVIGKIKTQKVPWINPDYILVKGNSFICAELSAQLANGSSKDVNYLLQAICKKEVLLEKPVPNTMLFEINRAAIFPFNKEIHAIARYEPLLKFQIIDYYSLRISGKVGKTICDVLPNCNNKKVIKDIEKIAWDSFDTIIIGHCDEYCRIIKEDYKFKLISEAINRKKNIYVFDKMGITDAQMNYSQLFSPTVTSQNISKRYGKLYKPNVPILTICGTNSKQGKFSLQLFIRNKLIGLGYTVGQIGTEPSSLLFNMDEVFPCGYNGQVLLTPQQMCSVVNKMIWNISQKNVDIILAGCQSGLLGYNDRNIDMIPFSHQTFFQSLQTDAIILCINEYDSLHFVERVINYAESLSGAKVLGLVCFPYSPSKRLSGIYGAQEHISLTREKELKKEYYSYFGIKVYMLDKKDELEDLVDDFIDFFNK